MATGDFWIEETGEYPYGLFDPDDVINIPVEFTEWMTSQGAVTYVNHIVSSDVELSVTTQSVLNGVIIVQVKKADAQVLTVAKKYGFTVQIEISDGQKRSKTLKLKIKEL